MNGPNQHAGLGWRSAFAVLVGVIVSATLHYVTWTWPREAARTTTATTEAEPASKDERAAEKRPEETDEKKRTIAKAAAATAVPDTTEKPERPATTLTAFHVTLRPEDFGKREAADAEVQASAPAEPAPKPAQAEPAKATAAPPTKDVATAAKERRSAVVVRVPSPATPPPAEGAPAVAPPTPSPAPQPEIVTAADVHLDSGATGSAITAPGAKLGSSPAPAFPALVLGWADLDAVHTAIEHHGFALAGVRRAKIVCAIRLRPTLHTEPWSASLGAFSRRARELPASLFPEELRAQGLDGAWLLVPVEVERTFEDAIRADLARRGVTPEQAGAVYGSLDTGSGTPRLHIDRVLRRGP